MAAGQLRALVLVAPMGIQPKTDYILDQFLISTESYARAAFASDDAFERIYGAEPEFDQLESWETDREMTSRLAWKPYMYNRGLPRLLAGVARPALDRLGRRGPHRAAGVRELYASALPNATLETYSGGRPRRRPRTAGAARRPRRQLLPGPRLNPKGEFAMHLMYFTEQPMAAWDPDSAALDEIAIGGGKSQRVTALLHSNRHFDPVAGGRLYNERLDEYQLVEEVGFDGIMLNEHHTAPFCMSPRMNLFATLLARITKKVKIVLLGNPLPIWDNPVHLAEELAIIDMISGGRLVSGFVRGGGVENIQANVNPLFNRERFEEAHDLLIKAWTTPGPFRWEGKHYQFRVVNPWATPVQKPFPRIWIPGVASKETVIWAAKHGYPYLGLNTNFDLSQKIKDIYTESAREVGYEPGPEHFGQLLQCHVADTEEKAERNAKEFMWMRGEFTGLAHPVWGSPTATVRLRTASRSSRSRPGAGRCRWPRRSTSGGSSTPSSGAPRTR